MRDQEVLIVGAGPSGLSMAIEFKRLGVPFRLVEKSLHPAPYSQALVVQARTLEQFERYGIAETAVQRGRPLKHASVISEGRTIVSFPFDKIPGHYPFVLFLPQNETEALLIEHLESLGGRIERGTEMLSIKEKDNGAEVQLRTADGNVENTAARWVVGCDGAHSTVRENLKIPFSGAKVSLNFFLGDLELEGPDLLGDELRIYLHHGDVVFIGRLREKVLRVIVALHSEQGAPERERPLQLSDFQEPMDRAGIRLRVTSALWMTPFRVSDRRAEHVRCGHIFLAGDASHIHSPVAGQGMNTGIQDTANLGWKIAAVENGADESLLESYEEERGKVSEQLLSNTSRVLKAVTSTSVLLEKLRDAFVHTATQIPFVQEEIVGFVSETAINYRHSAIVMDLLGLGSLRAGDRMPNPELVWKGRRMRLLDPLTSARALLVGFDVQEPFRQQALLPRAEHLFLNSDDLQMGKEELNGLIGESGVIVVRPDGYVGFRGTEANLDGLEEFAHKIGGTFVGPMEESPERGKAADAR
jgi:2-polyprenyl-6-methoxyphenol hydroxylase-like FAD-dependent oxidoreductase